LAEDLGQRTLISGKDSDAMNQNIPAIKRFAGIGFIILALIVQLWIGTEFIMMVLGTSQGTGTNWAFMFWQGLERTFASPVRCLWLLPLIALWTWLCAFGTRRFIVRDGHCPWWWFVLWLFLGGFVGLLWMLLYMAGFQLSGPVGVRRYQNRFE
jgi:RsiW-degrading membrane proteinase PrsW (M82 family)